jgi:hypothetical protein
LLLNAKWTICQLYHDENKLHRFVLRRFMASMVVSSHLSSLCLWWWCTILFYLVIRRVSVMVSVHSTNREFEPLSGQTKNYKIGNCFFSAACSIKELVQRKVWWYHHRSHKSTKEGDITDKLVFSNWLFANDTSIRYLSSNDRSLIIYKRWYLV